MCTLHICNQIYFDLILNFPDPVTQGLYVNAVQDICTISKTECRATVPQTRPKESFLNWVLVVRYATMKNATVSICKVVKCSNTYVIHMYYKCLLFTPVVYARLSSVVIHAKNLNLF